MAKKKKKDDDEHVKPLAQTGMKHAYKHSLKPRMNSGRPLSIATPEEMSNILDVYFAMCYQSEVFPMLTGIPVILGISKSALEEYKKREQFTEVVERAELICEYFLELQARYSMNPTAPIAVLERKFKWNRVTETLSTTMTWEQKLKAMQKNSEDVKARLKVLKSA